MSQSTMFAKYSYHADIGPLIKLAIPLALTGAMQSAIWFFQSLFLSHLGAETLAAGALCSWLYGSVAIILFGALSSINILVSYKHGAQDHSGIAYVARDGFLLALAFSVFNAILIWNIAPLFVLLGQSQHVVDIAKPYLHALSFGVPAVFLQMALHEVLIGLGKARILLFFTILTVVATVMSSYIFIFGKFGMPMLSIAGAGFGMATGYWVALLSLLLYITLNKTLRVHFNYIHRFDTTSYLMELFTIGFPTGLMYCIEIAFFFALTVSMGRLGVVVQAANQVTLQYLGIMMSTMFAVSQAITVRMGHLIGAGNVYAAERASRIGIAIAFLFIVCVAVVYWIFPAALISIDFDVNNPANAEIVRQITRLLSVCAIFQIFEAVRICLFGSLRGLKDTRFTVLTSITSFWCIALPVGYLFSTVLGLGGTGYWWAMALGAGVSVILLQWRFNQKIKHFLPSHS